jgi:hypothetical protein
VIYPSRGYFICGGLDPAPDESVFQATYSCALSFSHTLFEVF